MNFEFSSTGGDADMDLHNSGDDFGHASTAENPDSFRCHSVDKSTDIPNLATLPPNRRYSRRTRFEATNKDWRPTFGGSTVHGPLNSDGTF